MTIVRIPLIELVMRRVVKEGATGCWIWTGAIGHNGYGRVSGYGPNSEPKREYRPHRVTYEHFVAPIPEGMTIDHVCHTDDPTCFRANDCPHRRCCNPAHLEPVTIGDNVRRGMARRTHCIHGHEFTPENTIQTDKQRSCRTCSLARARKWKDDNRAAMNARRRARRAAAIATSQQVAA